MGPDLGAEPVLQRRDDPAAVGVVLRVGRCHQQHVERQPQRVPADLDVALLHHVQQRDLDSLGQVRQLVDRDDPAVRPRDQTEVNGLRVAQTAALGDLHRVHIADQVTDRRVRSRELLGVPQIAVQPSHRQVITKLSGAAARLGRDRVERMLRQLRTFDHRGPLVQQAHERAQQAGLALTALTQQYDVMPREQGAFELRNHRPGESDDPRPGITPGPEFFQQVVSDFGLDRPW
jgi:hypothetical protein